MGMAWSLLNGEGSADDIAGEHDANSYLLRHVVKAQSIIPSLHGLSIPTDQAAEPQRKGMAFLPLQRI